MYKYLFFITLFLAGNHLTAQTFTKITTGPLVSTPGDSRSIAWVDVNGDGFLDCFITNGPSTGQNNTLYLNNGAGAFSSVSNDPIVMDAKPSDGASFSDTDNDGDLDCFAVNWYNINNMFYTNNGNGNFTKIISGAPVTDGAYSETASWGDYDNDGLVDLYVTNSGGSKKNFLYKNTAANTFSKIIIGEPVTNTFTSRCVNWTDIDLDGDLDLFVSNEGGENENIYRNDGNGNFFLLTAGSLLNNAGNTMSSSWADFDNDGDLDVFLANDQGSGFLIETNGLFRNDGNFNFTKLYSDTVSKTQGRSFSSSWSDVDNDGDLDLFVTNAFKQGTKLVNYFYLNDGSGSFTRINNALTADSSWSYGCAFGDYDNDGFEDLAVATCRFNGSDEKNLLYHNDGNTNNWLTVKLEGVLSNRAAIGTKIRLKAIINGNPVWQMREVSAQNAYCSQNDLRAHFGLGDALIVDSVKIEWPSGTIQYSIGVSVNQFITITESVNVTPLIKNTEQRNNISVFPNPSTGIVILENSDGFEPGSEVVLSDMAGKRLVDFKITNASPKINIDLKKHHIASGSFLITIISSSEKAIYKLIIND